jgi:hypothetical protein
MSRHRLFALIAVLALGFMSSLVPRVAAQTAVQQFEQIVAARGELPVLAGPFEFDLVQDPGVLTVYRAGVDVADFVAHAEFTNPTTATDVGWDYGFQFRTAGNNEDFRVFVVSDSTWHFSIGTELPEQTSAAPQLDTEPGAKNTLDLIVVGLEAIFGINGRFAGSLLLPELDPSGDVYASTGFFSDLIVADRIIGLRDFTISAPPGTEAESAAPTVDASQTPARPVMLHTGSCDDLGEVVQVLTDATVPVGEPRGQASAVIAATSFTRVPIFLDDLLADPYAVNVAQSAEAPDTSIACGDIGGILDELGAYVVALPARNSSGYRGIAYIAPDPQTGLSSISVFLAPPPAPREPEASAPEATAPVETAPVATPEAVIEVMGTPAATPIGAPAATPAG